MPSSHTRRVTPIAHSRLLTYHLPGATTARASAREREFLVQFGWKSANIVSLSRAPMLLLLLLRTLTPHVLELAVCRRRYYERGYPFAHFSRMHRIFFAFHLS